MISQLHNFHHFKIYQICLVALLITLPIGVNAQDQKEEESEKFAHHRIALVLSHTHVPQGASSVNESEPLIIPSWGLDYEYWVSEKWAIGLHSDMEVSTYVIEDQEGVELERERPVILSLVGIYNPWQTVQFVAGFGREFEGNENFWVYRLGLEYEIEIGSEWDVAPSLVLDLKEATYNSWTLGIGVGKRF